MSAELERLFAATSRTGPSQSHAEYRPTTRRAYATGEPRALFRPDWARRKRTKGPFTNGPYIGKKDFIL
jgi:hypothetical protein